MYYILSSALLSLYILRRIDFDLLVVVVLVSQAGTLCYLTACQPDCLT